MYEHARRLQARVVDRDISSAGGLHREFRYPRRGIRVDKPLVTESAVWRAGGLTLPVGPATHLMAVVNVTPDSFSDGGRYAGEIAIRHGVDLFDAGAAIIDVGGESTRPGAEPVSPEEEAGRVVPVVRGLARLGVPVSVDTSKASVAALAAAAGAVAVNDVTALSDPAMAETVAGAGVGLVLMHMQGSPRTMQDNPQYGDVVAEVIEYLLGRAELAQSRGIPRDHICLDPGIGFGKTVRHNLALLDRLDELVATGYPVLIGTSRKAFLGSVLELGEPRQRDRATAITVALAAERGAFMARVHEVKGAGEAARLVAAIVRARSKEEVSTW